VSDYPQLGQMGILHPEEIRDYVVNSIYGVDVLRIFYKRKEGSLLPTSRSYEYPRVQRTITDGSGEPKTVLETAPQLRAAITELKEIVQAREKGSELNESLLDELEALENELGCRIQHLKDLLRSAP
jgi:hypothetical protein